MATGGTKIDTYTSEEIELAFFNHDTNGVELTCGDYERIREAWKSFKLELHQIKQRSEIDMGMDNTNLYP